MQIQYSPERDREISVVWAVGVFDGFHRGHQALLHRTVDMARTLGACPGVLTFHPHPREVLFGIKVPLIVPFKERILLISSAGAEKVWTIRFTPSFSRLSPGEFLRRYFGSLSRTRGIIVGEDFTFGRGGKRNRRLLRRFALERGIRLEIFPWVRENRRKISSQRIRRLISAGKMESAMQLLGRPFSVSSLSVPGKGRGQSLGFPTVNLVLPSELVQPRHGVYLVRFHYSGMSLPALANFGVRPTFESEGSPLLEVFVPGSNLSVPAHSPVTVEFLRFLRPERRFPSSLALQKQIQKDLAIFSNFVHTHFWEH